MKLFLDWLITKLILAIGFISSKLSIKKRTKLGRCIGNLLYFIGSKRRKITIENIVISFPEKPLNWCFDIAKKSYQNLGITFTELATFKYLNNQDFKNYAKVETPEIVFDAYSKNKGVLFISAHFGNWEILAYASSIILDVKMLIPVKPQKNKILDEILNKYRTAGGNKLVSMYNAAFEIVKHLRRGGIVSMLVDQSATENQDVFIEFFGREASTYESPAGLALKLNIPLIFALCIRKDDGTYSIVTIPIDHSDLTFSKEGIYELTKRHVNLLEEWIRKYPDHWAWQHRRWKHKPPSKIQE